MSDSRRARPLPSRWWQALFHPWTWRMAWRDSRAQRQRLILFSFSVVVGIGALVAVHSLRAALQEGVEAQAKSLLGSDLHIASREGFTPAVVADLRQRAQALTQEVEFSSMLSFPSAQAARMVEVRGLESGFPYYGKVETTPPGAWARLQGEAGVLLEQALLDQYGVKVGDQVKLGSLELPILGAVAKTPPRTSKFGGFAPEAYLRLGDLAKTGLLGENKIVFHHLHLQLAGEKEAAAIREKYTDVRWRYETPQERREALGDALNNVEEFLGLIAIASLVLGAIGVAGAIHAHVSRRVLSVAILRCLGCPGELAFSIYLVQALALGALAAVAGALFGVALHVGIVAFYRDALPFALEAAPVPGVVARTTLGGFLVCGIFALLPLLRVRDIAPGAALRENGATMLHRRLWPLYLVLALILTALGVLGQAHRLRALAMVGGLALTFALLTLVAYGLTRLARRLVRPAWPYLLRQGISNLYRPHNQTLLFLLSLGLGTFLLLTVLLVRGALLQKLNLKTVAESPSLYLIDVQPDQVAGVRALVRAHGLPILEEAPLVTMRLESVRGLPVAQLEQETNPAKAIPKWVLQREYRSSYRDVLTSTEKLVAGQWFQGPAEAGKSSPLSLEESIAKDLHLAVGDELVMDVQGVPVPARVSSIRAVDWSKFSLNFFMIFPPGVLEGAPGFHLLTTRLPHGQSSGELQRALVQQFPNVTAIDLTVILETVRNILEKVARIISLLAGFTVLSGLPILAATLLNGRDQRVRESVLLRTLGASARQIRVILLVEYTTLGVLSALTGVLLSVVAHGALAHFVFQTAWWPSPLLVGVTFLSAVALAVLGGLVLSRGVTNHPPLAVLRGAG